MMETIKFKNKDFEIIEKYKDNKIHVKRKEKDFIIVPFTTYFSLSTYLSNKKQLKRNKVEMSKIIKVDKKGLLILEQYINGEIATKLIADNNIEKYYQEIFRVFRNNRFAKIALNYEPNNFILKGKYLYYISDEIKQYNKDNSFEKSRELLLWMNTKESKDYVIDNGYLYKERNLLKVGGELNKAIALLVVMNW